jgi:hypothetical protein
VSITFGDPREETRFGAQMENLIKLHKAQLASDRMSCHSATADRVRLASTPRRPA